jgi:hypothetical protein
MKNARSEIELRSMRDVLVRQRKRTSEDVVAEYQQVVNSPTPPPAPSPRTPSRPIGQVVQLPFWPDTTRAIPNSFSRSALFTVRNNKMLRQQYKNLSVFAFGQQEMVYTGEELRQDDADVLLQIHHFARCQNVREAIVFRPADIFRALKWGNNGENYERLRNIIDRMKATSLKVSDGKEVFGGSLIRKFIYRPDEVGNITNPNVLLAIRDGKWLIWLEPEIVNLFDGNDFTLLDWELRLSLKPLGKWLHAYYRGHAKPFPVTLEKLRDACGSTTSDLSEFKRSLIKSLDDLVTGCFLESYEFEKDEARRDSPTKLKVTRAKRADTPADE